MATSPTARGRRFLARLVTTLVAGLAGLLAVGALPAAADTVGIGQYVALGDSYAAGQGASAPEDYHNKCLRSPNGYPALLDAENQIHLRANAACTGATTSDGANAQLSALKQRDCATGGLVALCNLPEYGMSVHVAPLIASCRL